MSESGPTLPTWALQQVGSYVRQTGRDANVAARLIEHTRVCLMSRGDYGHFLAALELLAYWFDLQLKLICVAEEGADA